jgi:hypothetical protein
LYTLATDDIITFDEMINQGLTRAVVGTPVESDVDTGSGAVTAVRHRTFLAPGNTITVAPSVLRPFRVQQVAQVLVGIAEEASGEPHR